MMKLSRIGLHFSVTNAATKHENADDRKATKKVNIAFKRTFHSKKTGFIF